MRRFHLLLITVLAVGLVACSPQDPEVAINDQVPADQRIAEPEPGAEGGAGGEAADIGSADAVWVTEGLAFTEAPSTMPADGATIAMTITDGQPHNVVFEGFEGDRELVEGAGAGDYVAQASVPAGDYTFYCSIAGHRTAGMEGSITVEGSAGGGDGDAEGGATEGDAADDEATESA